MRNPVIKRCREVLCMLLYYCMPSSLSSCIYTALIPCLAAYNILHLFFYYLALSSLYPSTFNGNVFTPLFHWFLLCNLACKYTNGSLHLCEPHPFCCLWSCEMHMGNYEEMTFNYMEVLVYRSFTCLRWALQRFPLVF